MSQAPDTPSLPVAECRHHWRIAPPNGPTVRGVCRRCGAEREFPTTTEDTAWDFGGSHHRREGRDVPDQ